MTCLNVMTVLAAVFMAVLSPAALAQQDYADKANSLIESYARSDLFSGSVLVAQHGKAIFRKAFGPANREWDIPNTLETKFRIGSVTKQITAAAILQLAEQGKLKLDDPMSKYYGCSPDLGEDCDTPSSDSRVRHPKLHRSAGFFHEALSSRSYAAGDYQAYTRPTLGVRAWDSIHLR